MSIDTQMIIVFGICTIFPVAIVLVTLPHFCWTKELKLIYSISNIISLIFFTVYINFLYRKSSPIICNIIDAMLNEISSPTEAYLCIISIICVTFCFAIFALSFHHILLSISYIFVKLKKLLHKFIRFLRKK